MDETVLVPSPNWFQVSGISVSKDGWFIYGGPSKSLCVLEPLGPEIESVLQGSNRYQAHVINKAHAEKITSIEFSPEWPVNMCLITGSQDGIVKHWRLKKENNKLSIKCTLSHDSHTKNKEEVIGVGYTTKLFIISVGNFGDIAKWDLNANVVRSYSHILKNFKPSCMSCSPHIPYHFAVGTKQGVVFVLNIEAEGKIVYKIRAQDDELLNVSWCPQYEVTVNKTLDEIYSKKTGNRSKQMKNAGKQKVALNDSGVTKKLPDDSFKELAVVVAESNEGEKSSENLVRDEAANVDEIKGDVEDLNSSGINKSIASASQIVADDEIFDIYKDHEADEFGHKKYQPHDIYVRVKKEEDKEADFLTECSKLKADMLKKDNELETINVLVDAMEKAHLDTKNKETAANCKSQVAATKVADSNSDLVEASSHIQKHLLATVGKYGSFRIWSKTGKLVASGYVSNANKKQKNSTQVSAWSTVLWYRPDVLLIGDGKAQLLQCNPLKVHFRNKLQWTIMHSHHKRGLFSITTNAPRVQTPNMDRSGWLVWTAAQERLVICYSIEENRLVSTHSTFGGFLYDLQTCPYDARRVAVSAGDGTVRIWESETALEDESKLVTENVAIYWQNVQGKVLTVAWHPTKENILAFATAESRVGIIETSGKFEKPAKALMPAPRGGVYALCWGGDGQLYATAGGALVVYPRGKFEATPIIIPVVMDGQELQVSSVKWEPMGLLLGGIPGSVVLMSVTEPHTVQAVAFPFNKMIHSMDWHPQQTSNSNEESPLKNLIAVCSLDKKCDIIILQLEEKDGIKKLKIWKTLTGHRMPVLRVSWNPHRDHLLLSTSQDSTVRVWDVTEGVCTSIFGNHTQCSLCAIWSPLPLLHDKVLSGGADCCLRMWDINKHPAHAYTRATYSPKKKTKKEVKKTDKSEDFSHKTDESQDDDIGMQAATAIENITKTSKKFLLPLLQKQSANCKGPGVKIMFDKYLEQNGHPKRVPRSDEPNYEYDSDFLKVFETAIEVNKYLDKERDNHYFMGSYDSWVMLGLFRGHIDKVIQYALRKNNLCPYLLSLTPCVSFKYWKDVTQLYLAQIDRLVAKGEEDKLTDSRYYGGPVFRKVATLLSVHDVKGALNTLKEARLFKEAYILCKIRYMDSMVEETLTLWAAECAFTGLWGLACVINIVLGNVAQAASLLARSKDQYCLSLAADMAKFAGQNNLADHVVEKKEEIKQRQENTEESLEEQLPSRIEMLLKINNENNFDGNVDNYEDSSSDTSDSNGEDGASADVQ